jgi:hypothetical protein
MNSIERVSPESTKELLMVTKDFMNKTREKKLSAISFWAQDGNGATGNTAVASFGLELRADG